MPARNSEGCWRSGYDRLCDLRECVSTLSLHCLACCLVHTAIHGNSLCTASLAGTPLLHVLLLTV